MQPVVEGTNMGELPHSNIWNTFLQSSISCYREFVNSLIGGVNPSGFRPLFQDLYQVLKEGRYLK